MITIEKLVANAIKLGQESHQVALAAAFCRSLRGADVRSLCVWCAEEHDAPLAFRLPKGGFCQKCSYVGYDCLVVAQPVDCQTSC